MTKKTRRQSQQIVSMSPQSIHAAIPRKLVRAVQDNRRNFVDDLGPLPKAEIRELLEKLTPYFLVNETSRAIRHHEAVSTAPATRAYVAHIRKLKPTEITTLGRMKNTVTDLDTRSLFEYQFRRPDFTIGAIASSEVRDEIDSIMLTGYTLHERRLHEKLFNYDSYMEVPSYERSALRNFLHGLQQTERFALISDFVEAITDDDRSKQVEMIANQVRQWLNWKSYCSCEQLYDLSNAIAHLKPHVQADLAAHYGSAKLHLPAVILALLSPADVTAIAIASGMDRSKGTTRIDESTVAKKIIAFSDAQKEANLVGNLNPKYICSLYSKKLA